MKRRFLSILIVALSLSFITAEDIYETIFGKYISNDYSCYNFIVHNPTFFNPEYYFPESTKMKNAILLEKDTSYWINEAGYKLWSDDDTPETGYTYYHFDEIGHIYKMNYIRIKDNGYIFCKETRNYNLANNQYIVEIIDEESGQKEKKIYEITYSDKSLFLKQTEDEYLYCYEFTPGKIIFSSYKNNVLAKTILYEYKNDLMKVHNYSLTNKDKRILSVKEFTKGCRSRETCYLNNGEGTYTRENHNEYNLMNYVETRNNVVCATSIYKEEVLYSDLEYKESIRISPFKKESGNYTVLNYYLMFQQDDILKKFFK